MKKLAMDIGNIILTNELGVNSLPIDDDFISATSVSEMRTNLCGMSERELEKLHEQVLKYVCGRRKPLPEQKYYEFNEINSNSVLFYSKGVSWEEGEEVRLARSVNDERIFFLRSRLDKPIYIIRTKDELNLWVMVWKGRAFLTLEMVEKFMPDLL